MNILYLEDDFITAEQSKDIINFYNHHVTKSYVYYSGFNNISYPLNILNQYKNQSTLNTSVSRIVKLCKGFIYDTKLDNLEIVKRLPSSSMNYHVDNAEGDILAGIVYLNDDYSGGSTGFESFQVEPKVGRLIIFSNAHYRHCVNEVKGNDRYTLSLWFVKNPV
tara:strand:- start:277 stop:768 length:492 start_codon:yes stop_codon:yes gene_type:complete